MKIFEILDMVPLAFEWIDEEKALFKLDSETYGILLQQMVLNTSVKNITVVNVSFGRLVSKVFTSGHDLDASITNAGKARTVLSTVAAACLKNKLILSADLIAFAAADQAKAKRAIVYGIALNEIMRKVPKFSTLITAKTPTDATILFLSSIPKLSEKEINYISTHLGIHDKMYLSD